MNELGRVVRRQLVQDLRQLPALARARWSTAGRLERCGNIAELRALARRTAPRAVFDFADGAANDEATARSNERDFARLRLHPRVLVDVSEVDLATTVLGQPVRLPLIGGPTGLTGLVHHDGERGIARAAVDAGTVYVLSAMASYSIEEVASAAAGPLWFQLYVWRDRGLVRELIERARAAGCKALVLTVDVPRAGQRERDRRNGFGIPPRVTARTVREAALRPRWSSAFVRRPRITVANLAGAQAGGDAVALTEYVNRQFDPSLSWDDLASIREQWGGPLVVKGILRPDDARRAVDAGAAAVVVSNHGGRQLDHAPSGIGALPGVVEEIGDDAEVYVDGGVRRGSDVLKAIALGARACLVGRALVYGVGAGGEAGARRALELLARELEVAMALSGCPALDAVGRDLVAPEPHLASS